MQGGRKKAEKGYQYYAGVGGRSVVASESLVLSNIRLEKNKPLLQQCRE